MALALLPFAVAIPAQEQLVAIAYFFPMVFGVMGAVSLTEHTQWLRPRRHALHVLRASVTAVTDLACLAAFVLTVGHDAERLGVIAGALLCRSVAMVIAVFSQELAWLGAALGEFVCLLSFDGPVILLLPLDPLVAVYLCSLTLLAVRGPRSRR